ncbi:MAG: hypothetical protein ABI644_09115 [Arenimonas sp.]
MQRNTFLEYGSYRFLKISALFAVLAILAYGLSKPATGHYGGTWLGYTLGSAGALIIFFLLWFGIRKRQYRSSAISLKSWLSAHVYLGVLLIVIVTLHTGFELGWNIHSIAYVLMLLVIFSGFYGVYAYLRFPRLMTEKMGEDTLENLFLKIGDADLQMRQIALLLPDEINQTVLNASQQTRIGGGFFQQLSGRQKNCPTALALQKIQHAGAHLKDDQARINRELYFQMLNKQTLINRAREDVMFRARLEVWLYFHVPLSIALLAALLAHIVSVFFYW